MDANPSLAGPVGAECSSAPAPESAPAPAMLAALPLDLLVRMLSHLGRAPDLAAANATSRLFRGAPGARSPVERVLRERARARGHERALPATLPTGSCTWTEELLARERVLEVSALHSGVVAAGSTAWCWHIYFSAFVDVDGCLHTCGEEEDLDVEGDDMAVRYAPAVIAHGTDAAAPPVRVPTRVASLSEVRVVAVAAGRDYLLALSEAGTVYGCGCNDSGQLGLAGGDDQREFVLVGALLDEAIVCIATDGGHSLALTAAGCAYSWGRNEYGQLGHGDTSEHQWEPTRIEALDGVRFGGVAAGGEHTLLLSTGGAVHSCGKGYPGPLGHGDERDLHMPRHIEALAGVRAVHVSAGYNHSLVVDSEGGVLSFGYGDHGKLGHGDDRDAHTPRRIKALAGVRAVRAYAGVLDSAVVGADGSVHTFGLNRYGQLGLGDVFMFGFMTPSPVCVHALSHERVVSCALGAEHALYVTAEGAVYSCGLHTAALGHGGAVPASASVVTVQLPESGEDGAAVATPSPISQQLLPLLRRGGAVE